MRRQPRRLTWGLFQRQYTTTPILIGEMGEIVECMWSLPRLETCPVCSPRCCSSVVPQERLVMVALMLRCAMSPLEELLTTKQDGAVTINHQLEWALDKLPYLFVSLWRPVAEV